MAISPNLGRAGQSFLRLYDVATLVLGGMYTTWLLQTITWATFPYIVAGIAILLVSLSLTLHVSHRTQYFGPIRYGLRLVTDGLSNNILGGLGVAWVTLAFALAPFFFSEPLTLLVVVVYGGLLATVFVLKWALRKAVSLY